jgi:hypothetical protein
MITNARSASILGQRRGLRRAGAWLGSKLTTILPTNFLQPYRRACLVSPSPGARLFHHRKQPTPRRARVCLKHPERSHSHVATPQAVKGHRAKPPRVRGVLVPTVNSPPLNQNTPLKPHRNAGARFANATSLRQTHVTAPVPEPDYANRQSENA